MKAFVPLNSHAHRPVTTLEYGRPVAAVEIPERVDAIRESLRTLEFVEQIESDELLDMSHVQAVHSEMYLSHLRQAPLQLHGEAASAGIFPSIFPYAGFHRTEHPRAMLGQFCYDLNTPLFAATYQVAMTSANCALQAARCLLDGERSSYALCRPPGHHAEESRSGGFCYLNNSAIAAAHLATQGKVAVLDIDVHHGNGTQSIFYDRDDVLTLSIHGHPDILYPFFSGREDETGTLSGLGANLNIPLPDGADTDSYDAALASALEAIEAFRPDFVVVPFGADAHVDDPLGCFRLPTAYFTSIGKVLAGLKTPIVVVQEGGYALSDLGATVAAFLTGLAN